MKKPKKILIFSVAYYPKFVGGAEVAVKEITDRLNPDDYEFHLLTLRLDRKLSKTEKIGNVFVHRLGFVGEMKESADSLRFPLHYNKYIYPFLATWKGLTLSRKHHFDLIWSVMANYSGFGALFFKLLKPEIPFLLNLQEGDPIAYIKKRVGLMYPVFKLIFKKANVVQALSTYLADWAKEMGFNGEPMVIPNGVDIKKFDVELSKEERLKIRGEWGLKEGDMALITTSRLVVKNGVGDVIKALALLPKNLKFVIFGEGYLKESLELLAESLEVGDRVIFKGFVSHTGMSKYLKSGDIFIRPSLSEGFGNSFIEAMAARLPVVATPVGGILDFIEDGATGYFCEVQNPDSIAKTVKRVINDVGTNRVVDNAYKMVVEKYDWDLVAKKMKEIFESV